MFKTEKITYGDVVLHLMYYSSYDINNHLHNLLPEEIERLNCFKHPSRKQEFVATRILRSIVVGNEPILYNEIGAPFIESEGYISISHAKNVVGLAFCKDFPIGLDLEPIDKKVLRVKHKFLNKSEIESLNTDDITEMIKVWSGKEALYKLAERKGIVFAKELLLEKINDSSWSGYIIHQNTRKKVSLSIEKKDNFVISINLKAPLND